MDYGPCLSAKMNKNSRRNFIRNASVGAVASALFPDIVSAAFADQGIKKISLKKNDTILFQGDSVTDWWRSYDSRRPNTTNALGAGFVLHTAGSLLVDFADKNLQIYDKGVAGNKVFQLAERWDDDCIRLKPDILSILIGVNDFSHTLWYGYKGTPEIYISDYRRLLTRTRQALPNVQLVVGEPFALKFGKLVNDNWFPAFYKYQEAAKKIADEFDAVFIPFQSVFNKALILAPAQYWSADGIHPSVAGAALMARAWRQIVS